MEKFLQFLQNYIHNQIYAQTTTTTLHSGV